MAPTLYLVYPSPPVRSVLMTAKAIGVDLIEKEISILGGDHMKPDYLKLNPQHTVPTLVDDDGFTLWDSHAIMIYLVSKYAKNDDLYPKDLHKRALVDQRLHFETGVVFVALAHIAVKIIFEGETVLDKDDKDNVNEAFEFLETFLDGRRWVAGDSITIADYSLITTIKNLDVLVPVDSKRFPKVATWIKNCEQLPEYEDCVKKGLEMFKTIIRSRLGIL